MLEINLSSSYFYYPSLPWVPLGKLCEAVLHTAKRKGIRYLLNAVSFCARVGIFTAYHFFIHVYFMLAMPSSLSWSSIEGGFMFLC